MSNSRATAGAVTSRGDDAQSQLRRQRGRDDPARVGLDLDLDDGRGTLAVGDIGLPATGTHHAHPSAGCAFRCAPQDRAAAVRPWPAAPALLTALAPGARLLLHLALAPEHRLRQHRPSRAELRKLGFQRLDARRQRRPLGLQVPHLGAQPGVLPAQRHDHIRRPRGRRPQPVVALAQPRDGAIPGPHQPRGRRAPPVELLAQRGDLAVVPVRRLAERSAQPSDVLVQPIDLVAMPGLDPLLVGVGPPQKVAETVDLAVQESNPALLAFRPPHVLLQPSVLLPQRRDRLLGVPRSPVSRARPGLRRPEQRCADGRPPCAGT